MCRHYFDSFLRLQLNLMYGIRHQLGVELGKPLGHGIGIAMKYGVYDHVKSP
jgi:hypothetical protein